MRASFTKIKHFLPSDTHTYEIIVYRKIWPALFSWNTRFDIYSFALLPGIYGNIRLEAREVLGPGIWG